MSILGNKSHRKLSSLSASAFAALLVLAAAAPSSAQPGPRQHNDTGSNAGSAPSSSSGNRGSSGGGSSSSSGGSSSSSGGSTSSSWHGDRGGGGGHRGEGRGGGRGRGGYGRGGGGHHGGGHSGHGGYRRGGYRGGYYGGWGGYYGGWGGYWPWWYPGYGGPTIIVERDRYGYDNDNGGGSGAFDLDLTPESAQIFIDGEYVGQADDYDGFPTFLWLRAGTYDVAFYAPGYQTIVRQYTVRPGTVIDVEDRMTPGESIAPEQLMTPKTTEVRDARIRRNVEQNDEVDRMEAEEADRGSRGGSSQEVGRISLSVWPPDAAIYLDGHFLGTSEEIGQLSAGLVVEPGEHEIEVVRPGYGTIRRSVTVTAGEKSEVKLDLDKN